MQMRFTLTQDEIGTIVAEHIRREHNLNRATIALTWNRPPVSCQLDVSDDDMPPKMRTSVFTESDDENAYFNEGD